MPRRTLLSAATHAWRATDHLHLLGAQRDDPAPDSPLAQFREALGTALERARTVDGIYAIGDLVGATERLVQVRERERDLLLAEEVRRVKLRLGLIGRTSQQHEGHACPQDDCLECWPGDVAAELREESWVKSRIASSCSSRATWTSLGGSTGSSTWRPRTSGTTAPTTTSSTSLPMV